MNFPKEFIEYVASKAESGVYKPSNCYVVFSKETLGSLTLIHRLIYASKILEKTRFFSDIDAAVLYGLKKQLREKGIYLSEALMDEELSPLQLKNGQVSAFVLSRRYENCIVLSDVWPLKNPPMQLIAAALVRALMALPMAENIIIEVPVKEQAFHFFDYPNQGEIWTIGQILGINDEILPAADDPEDINA